MKNLFDVYVNIFKVAKVRGVKPVEKQKDREWFNKTINMHKFIAVEFVDDTIVRPFETKDVLTIFVVLKKDSASLVERFRKVLKKLDKKKQNMDIVFISFETNSHVEKFIAKLNSENAPGKGTRWIRIMIAFDTTFRMFVFDLPTVPKQRLLSQKEKEVLYKEFYFKKFSIQKADDPMNTILGGWPGQIVEIRRNCMNSGEQIMYRQIE